MNYSAAREKERGAGRVSGNINYPFTLRRFAVIARISVPFVPDRLHFSLLLHVFRVVTRTNGQNVAPCCRASSYAPYCSDVPLAEIQQILSRLHIIFFKQDK